MLFVNNIITTTCCCGKTLYLKVLKSNVGYYLGFSCPECGPYDRIGMYYETRSEAFNTLLWFKEEYSSEK